MTYDLTTPDIQCHADKEGATVYGVRVTGWSKGYSKCRRVTYRVLGHHEEDAMKAAWNAYDRDNPTFNTETAALL